MIEAKVKRKGTEVIVGARCCVCNDWIAIAVNLVGILTPLRAIIPEGMEKAETFEGPVMLCGDCLADGYAVIKADKANE